MGKKRFTYSVGAWSGYWNVWDEYTKRIVFEAKDEDEAKAKCKELERKEA